MCVAQDYVVSRTDYVLSRTLWLAGLFAEQDYVVSGLAPRWVAKRPQNQAMSFT